MVRFFVLLVGHGQVQTEGQVACAFVVGGGMLTTTSFLRPS